MKTIYIYLLNTLADWETGHVTAELASRRFFKEGAPKISLKTVSHSNEPIITMGGMTMMPDCVIDDIEVNESSILILPGADTWNDSNHYLVLEKARELLAVDGTVCAICGATVALASTGLLDNRIHTSNGPGFLDMFAPSYKGQGFYIDEPSVADKNLITASATGGLLWAKQIIEHLDVFKSNTLEAWYAYFNTGKPEYFFTLMQTLPSAAKSISVLK